MNVFYTLFCITLASFTFLFTPTVAQDSAYIISIEGDTIRGLVLQEQSQQVIFRKSKSDEPEEYAANELLGYGDEHGDHFVSMQFSEDSQQVAFFKVVVVGPVALYHNKGLRPEADFYIQKQNESLTQLHRQFYAGTLSSLLSDCPAISILKVKYTNGSLRDAVHAYNQCRYADQSSKAYINEKDRVLIKAGLKVGVAFTNASIQGALAPEGYTFSSNPGFTAGLIVNFRMPDKMLSLQPELWFLQRNTRSVEYFERPYNGSYTGTIVLDANLVQLPLLVKFGFGQKSWQPYLLAGPTINFVVTDDFSYIVEYDGTQRPFDKEISGVNSGIGFSGGAGVSIASGKQRYFLLELRYSQEHFSGNSLNQNFRYSTIQLSGGITL